MVKCGTCNNDYHTTFPNGEANEQAPGCASSVTRDGVIGCYGSRTIDMKRYTWADGRPEHVGGTVICDLCADDLIKEGKLMFDEDGIW